ncbi:MAG: hypothetical protein HC828_01590 [Blastochloris sp.]|nr:hypothetical protein [Blastochloris sp.]
MQHHLLTSEVWRDPQIVRTVGFITYAAHLAMPALAAVEERYGTRFTSAEALRRGVHTTANIMIAGMGALPDHPGGAADPVIAARLTQVGSMHQAFAMPGWAMSYIIGLLTIGPAWAQGHAYPTTATEYHQAANRVAVALGTRLPAAAKLDRWLHTMTVRHAAPSAYGVQALRLFAEVYPDVRVIAGLAAVPPAVRAFVTNNL